MPKSRNVRERSFEFALATIRLAREIVTRDPVLRRIAFQLTDAAGSVGANLEEAAEGQSKRDFIAKNAIAAKEARESRFWLRLLIALEPTTMARARLLEQEASELVAMLVAVMKTAKSNPYRGRGE